MNKRIWIILLLIIAVLPGCKKYDDGPVLSLYSKGMRVSGTWYFENVRYDGQDSTKHYPYQQLYFFYDKEYDGGGFTWNHNVWTQERTDEMFQNGVWRFMADRDSFEMVVYKNMTRDSTIYRWKINRLAYTEFWLERTIRDTINVQWKLVKYVY